MADVKVWNVNDRAIEGTAVTPHDTTEVKYDALFIGTGGDVAVLLMNDTIAVTLKNTADGSFLPIGVKKVLSTGTTATNIIGFILG